MKAESHEIEVKMRLPGMFSDSWKNSNLKEKIMNVAIQIFLGVVGLTLSYSLVKYTEKVAEYTLSISLSSSV